MARLRTSLAVLWMSRCMIAASCFAFWVGSTSDAMAAPRFQSACSHSAARFTPDRSWQIQGPYWIVISQRTVAGIESQAPGRNHARESVRRARCSIASSVAYGAMEMWESWSANGGSIEVKTSAASSPRQGWILGRFSCRGTTTGWDGAIETCRHPSNTREGLIIVQFSIRPT
jgi:hypothetical protein